ncbi:hypothetical protein K501DRAFT_280308 [Backusella circina FSU 941]|nr:hypothetical protein K501DRAFT_280308 [Backusella circina FSU 941]
MSVSFMNEECATLSGSTCRIKISVQKSLVAEVELEYERQTDSVVIHQYDIKGPKEENKNNWQESQHLVFQKLNLLAKSAFEDILVFYARESLYSLLEWIGSYYNLFTEPCHRCHTRLQFDSPQYKYLPPMVRTWTKKSTSGTTSIIEQSQLQNSVGIAYHMRCFIEATKTTI